MFVFLGLLILQTPGILFMTNTAEIRSQLGWLSMAPTSIYLARTAKACSSAHLHPEPARPADEDEEGPEPGTAQPTGGEELPRAQQACQGLGTLPRLSVGLREGMFGGTCSRHTLRTQKHLVWHGKELRKTPVKNARQILIRGGSASTKGGFRFPKTSHSPSSCEKHLGEHLSHGTCQK